MFFNILSNGRRIAIIRHLYESGDQNVTEISRKTGIEQSAVSHSLTKLLGCGFVHIEIRGKHRYYSLNKETIVPLLKIIDTHIDVYCNATCNCCSPTIHHAKDEPLPVSQ